MDDVYHELESHPITIRKLPFIHICEVSNLQIAYMEASHVICTFANKNYFIKNLYTSCCNNIVKALRITVLDSSILF